MASNLAIPSYIHFLPAFYFIIKNKPKKVYEFGKDIPFDQNNNNSFEFKFPEDGSLFIQVEFRKRSILTLLVESFNESVSESSNINPPGKTTVIPFKKGIFVIIRLYYKSSSNEKGTIWMFPSTSEIKLFL